MDLNQITIASCDVARAASFYRRLGLRLIVDSAPRYVRFECPTGTSTFSVHHVDELPPPATTTIYFECKDLDRRYRELTDQGIEFDSKPEDQRWLWREARLRDPDGNPICLYHGGEYRRNPPWRIDHIGDSSPDNGRPRPTPATIPVTRKGAIASTKVTSGKRLGSAFMVLYRWRLHDGAEVEFIKAWSEVTACLRDRWGSLGSRLHRGEDGLWYGYAQWPDQETRQTAFSDASDIPARKRMRDTIAETLPEIVLDPVSDYLFPLTDSRRDESNEAPGGDW